MAALRVGREREKEERTERREEMKKKTHKMEEGEGNGTIYQTET